MLIGISSWLKTADTFVLKAESLVVWFALGILESAFRAIPPWLLRITILKLCHHQHMACRTNGVQRARPSSKASGGYLEQKDATISNHDYQKQTSFPKLSG